MAINRQTIKVLGELQKFIKDTTVKVSINATAEVSADTPVLTGWAQANWIPSIGAKSDDPFGSREAVSLSAQNAGIALLLGTYQLPHLVHITNNVPYIGVLNTGTSTKAPSDFIQTAIAKAIKSII